MQDHRPGPRRFLHFHRLPEKPVGKNRMHLDVRAPAGTACPRQQTDDFVDLILIYGGRKERGATDDAGYFVVMADPEGNVFCVGAVQGS